MIVRPLRFALVLLTPLALLACGSGSDTNSSGAGGDDDGRYHPPSNGQHQAEADACAAIRDGFDAKFQAMSCVGTKQANCPDLLQAQFGTGCHEYDQGTVQGCIDYYGEQTSCDALRTAFQQCAVLAYACQ